MNKPGKIPSEVAGDAFESCTKEFGFYVMWLWPNCVAFCVRIQLLISSVLVTPDKMSTMCLGSIRYGEREPDAAHIWTERTHQ